MLKLAPRSRAFDPRGEIPNVSAQVEWFRAAFPGGFDDPAWRRDARGERPPGRVTTGITRASAALREVLADPARHEDAGLADITRALRTARLPWLRPMGELAFATHPAVSADAWFSALRMLLDADEGNLPARFDAWVAAHEKPAWPVVTAVPALCDLGDQLFVRPPLVDAQARALGIARRRAARPTGADYAACLTVGRALANELSARGVAPRDLADVALFSARALTGAQARRGENP